MKTIFAIIALSLSASAATLTQEPASFTVVRSELTNQYAVLAWALPAGITNTVIYRAYGEGGPWTELAETNNLATTWTDETAPLGVPCWYKIAFAERDEEDVRTVGDMCAATVSHRRCQLLERDWSDMTHVKDGVTVIWNAPYNTTWWNGGKNDSNQTISKPATAQKSAEFAFDDMWNSAPNIGYASAGTWHAVGVDLGSQFFVSFVRCHPRYDSAGNRAKINGMAIYGANGDIGNAFSTNWPAISDTLTDYSSGWHEILINNIAPYRYFYACNASDNSWRLMVGELQFYGCPASAYDGYAIGAVDFAAVWDGGASVALSWKDNGYGTSFNVERSTDGGTTWTAIASGLSATSYTDADITLDGVERLYRIASVSGTATSYSKTARVVPYVRGDGVGLHRSALFPFISTEATEMTEYVSTGAVCIADATLADARPMIEGVEGSHTNVYVTWTGKLIVPFAGSYKFTAAAKGMVSVWIDDSNVTRYSAASKYTELTSDATTLTAGEHDIRVAYWQGVADSGCTLYWDGAVAKEVIPLSQLKPVVPNALPEPWKGVRSITSSATEFYPSDSRVNADGTFDLAFTGADINYTDGRIRGHNFLYRPFKGDFNMTLTMKMNASWKAGEKGGLKVAANLTEASPFEAFFLRGNKSLGLRARRSGLSEPKSLDGKSAWGTSYTSSTIYMRLERKGSVFTYCYRAAKTEPWTAIYQYDDSATGYYGDTVYVGPVATCVSLGANSWGGDSYRTARYAWRFSEIDIHSPHGACILLR